MSSPRKAMAILVSVLALLMPTSASAGQPDSVDPAIMQPALNPSFAPWDCWRTGTGIRLRCGPQHSPGRVPRRASYVKEGPSIRRARTSEPNDGSATKQVSALKTNVHAYIRETLSLTADGSGPTLRASANGSITSNTSSPVT